MMSKFDLNGAQIKVDAYNIAAIAHSINKAYCHAIGDDTQPAWKDAPMWQKESAINGVQAHLINDMTPDQSHNNWMAEKIAAGWEYGEEKDPELKTHPCIVAYEDLPLEQRIKDHLFKGVVEALKDLAKTHGV